MLGLDLALNLSKPFQRLASNRGKPRTVGRTVDLRDQPVELPRQNLVIHGSGRRTPDLLDLREEGGAIMLQDQLILTLADVCLELVYSRLGFEAGKD